MYIYLRILQTVARARRAPRLGPLDVVRTKVRIFPNDLDFNGHVNNGRYLTLFDLGRLDLGARTGLWRVCVKRKWFPVLASATVRFRKSAQPFWLMDISTQVIFFDEKWLYIEHRLEKGGELYAKALVKGVFRGPNGVVPMAQMLEALGIVAESRPMPELVRKWVEFEGAMR